MTATRTTTCSTWSIPTESFHQPDKCVTKPVKLSKLVELACSLRDENEMENDPDVYVESADGVLCDFEVGYVPEQFDGFETAYPSCIKLVSHEADE